MFGLGWSEMVLIGIVALIVIGPKDLPVMFRTLGQFTGKARQMAREFSRAMESAADDAGVKDITKTIKAAANPQKFGVDKLKEATDFKSAIKPGGETEKLSQERAEIRDKIQEATAVSPRSGSLAKKPPSRPRPPRKLRRHLKPNRRQSQRPRPSRKRLPSLWPNQPPSPAPRKPPPPSPRLRHE
jgi:sec-independent protein translocase protein TatB